MSSTALGLWGSPTASDLWVLGASGQVAVVSFPHPTEVSQWREEGTAHSKPQLSTVREDMGASQGITRAN